MIMKKYLGIGFAAGVMICDALVMIFSSFVIVIEKIILVYYLKLVLHQVLNV